MKMKKLVVPMLSLTLMIPALAGAEAAPAAAMMKASVNTPAAELRAGLDYLLSEHFTLAVTAMTKAYDGTKDAASAYQALDQNALDMQPAIASLYGDAGAAEFERIFRAHNKYTDDLVKATKNKDTAAVKAAEDKVSGFVDEFGNFLGTATEGKLPAAAAKQVIRSHENHVQEVFEDYAAGDYKGAYEAYRKGYAEMFGISKALSSAITMQMPAKFENTKADTKAADLRSALNQLAGEHFALSVLQMQEQYDGRAASNALIGAEAMNTADFKAAIASIYGAEGAAAFEKIWVTNHVNAQADFVTAVKNNDAAGKAAVEARIAGFTTEFAAFLDSATAGNLPKSAGQSALTTHENQVQQVLTQYAAGNYDASYKTNREGYKTMFGVGQALGNAIVTQFNDKFQDAAAPAPATPADPASMTKVWMKVGSGVLNINGQVTQMDTKPFIWSGMTYIPLRYLSEGIGADVKWDKQAQQVTIKAGNDTLVFWMNKDFMEVNGMRKSVGAKVFVNDDNRTVVPLRFITELLGWNVQWGTADRSITLTKSM
ncbi:copper amine oxidase N-terminal domain-containing protein [Paenibacillus sp. FSL R7-0337]|uniref:copper amine oxidase N-terminal domain-containing protein n=1 Tax=Paenibacillus sp. FSL R7-0337 TaxID=1926588 RepID=UPI00096F1FDE|nr:copper amine oxidase N-terminal domain-containing protein [Paenibacillus sp. FSL R7-0337]OMF97032.1 copper amine oxidase [Paenibacillus sp. FSL R7-0337]